MRIFPNLPVELRSKVHKNRRQIQRFNTESCTVLSEQLQSNSPVSLISNQSPLSEGFIASSNLVPMDVWDLLLYLLIEP